MMNQILTLELIIPEIYIVAKTCHSFNSRHITLVPLLNVQCNKILTGAPSNGVKIEYF